MCKRAYSTASRSTCTRRNCKMYNQTKWEDRVTQYEDRFRETQNPDGTFTHTPVEGEIIQVGTPQNQTNFNNMENGIQDSTLAGNILAWLNLHQQRRNDRHESIIDSEILGELHNITLTNTANLPFNSTFDSPVTIALNTTRKNLFYSVEPEIKESSGIVGDIIISNKALNGFKIAFTGSGKSVTLAVRIKGGMS